MQGLRSDSALFWATARGRVRWPILILSPRLAYNACILGGPRRQARGPNQKWPPNPWLLGGPKEGGFTQATKSGSKSPSDHITCSKVSVPPRGNTIDWFPLTHTTHHHPQQCRLCRYNRRTQPARPREPSYMHQVTDSPPPAENKLQSSAARQRRSPESHTRRELARVSATS